MSKKSTNRLMFKFSIVILPIIAILLGAFITVFSILQSNLIQEELILKAETYAVSISKAVSRTFEHAIDTGEYSENDILGFKYIPITDKNDPFYVEGAVPMQDPYAIDDNAAKYWADVYFKGKQMRYRTPYSDLAEFFIRPYADSFLMHDTNVDYAAVVDKYGYVPAHNSKYSNSPTGDSKSDALSRTMSFFKDRTGLNSIKNTNKDKPLRQEYPRVMGDKTVLFWDISYPIYVKGQHWGAIRIGYVQEKTIEKSMFIVILFAIAGVGLLIIMFFSIYIITRILVNRPLKKLNNSLHTLSEGNLSTRCPVKTKDELGHLSESMNMLASKFENIIMSAVASADSFSVATTEIAAGNQDLAQRTSEQASNLEEITASIEEVSANIDTNLKNSENAKKLSEEIKKRMEGLNESSQKMHEIIQVIDSIAFETNLLALNAAIEAARAGEAGRGFEVVATEVKELSQRSSSQAKEIYVIIEESITRIKENVKKVENIVDIINEISTSSADQHESAKQISSAISQLNEVTQQNASLVEESAATSEEIASQAQRLKEEISYFHSDMEDKTLQIGKVVPKEEDDIEKANLKALPKNDDEYKHFKKV